MKHRLLVYLATAAVVVIILAAILVPGKPDGIVTPDLCAPTPCTYTWDSVRDGFCTSDYFAPVDETLTVTGTIDATCAPGQVFSIKMYQVNNPEIIDSCQVTLSDRGEFTHTFTGLSSNSHYYFHVIPQTMSTESSGTLSIT